jgi:hypothetical protein
LWLVVSSTRAGEPAVVTSELRGTATGFFHLERLHGRQFLVTPQGRAFVALGLNHCSDETTTTAAGQQAVLANLRAWGFNSGDYQAPEWMRREMPYLHGITLVPNSAWMTPGQFGFRDVFDPAFLAELESRIREACLPQRENPNLIGYFFTDVPRWSLAPAASPADESLIILPELARENWIGFFQRLPADAPGRRQWEDWRAKHPKAEDELFLGVIARQLYGRAHEFLRRFDRNHLILGERYFEHDMPDVVVREALPFVDALSLQPASPEFDPAYFQRLASAYGKPLYLCDHVSSFRTTPFPRTMGQVAATAEDYVGHYRRYVVAALSHPAIIGYNRCQYRSRIRIAGNPPLLKQGLLDLEGRPYASVVAGVVDANRAALQAAYAAGGAAR